MQGYLTAMNSYATFAGRTSRAEFWRAHIVLLPLMLIAFSVFGPSTSPRSVWATLFFVLIVVPHVIPWAALAVRRLHDMDQTGWWALLALVPLIMVLPLGLTTLLVWTCRAGTPGPNGFGAGPRGSSPMPHSPETADNVSAPAKSPDVVREIERLAGLKAAGGLSQAEFDALKAQALAQAYGA